MFEIHEPNLNGDQAFHVVFSNGALVSYSTYNDSVRAWWTGDGEDIIIDTEGSIYLDHVTAEKYSMIMCEVAGLTRNPNV